MAMVKNPLVLSRLPSRCRIGLKDSLPLSDRLTVLYQVFFVFARVQHSSWRRVEVRVYFPVLNCSPFMSMLM